MNVGDTLLAASQAGLTLTAGENDYTLTVYPAAKLTPQLVAALKEHKADIIKVLVEDEEMARSGVIQSERQVFELAREFFGTNERERVE